MADTRWYSEVGGGGEAGTRSPLTACSAREDLQGTEPNFNRRTSHKKAKN